MQSAGECRKQKDDNRSSNNLYLITIALSEYKKNGFKKDCKNWESCNISKKEIKKQEIKKVEKKEDIKENKKEKTIKKEKIEEKKTIISRKKKE